MFNFKLLCATVVLFCAMDAAVESQPTIGETDISCFDNDLSEFVAEMQHRNQHLLQTLETEPQRVKDLRKCCAVFEKRSSDNASLLTTLNSPSLVNGVTYSGNKIYILLDNPQRLCVYEGQEFNFTLQKTTDISYIKDPEDVAYSDTSKCLYISDKGEECVWKIDLRNNQVTKWLLQRSLPFTLSISPEGHVLILKIERSSSHLEIYRSDATLIRSIQLSDDIRHPRHAIQIPTGDFIVSHQMKVSSQNIWVITKLSSEGQVLNVFVPWNVREQLREPAHLAFDSINNRLFVMDLWRDEVIQLDPNFCWSRTLLSNDKHTISTPTRICYNPDKSLLIVGQWGGGTKVFKIKEETY